MKPFGSYKEAGFESLKLLSQFEFSAIPTLGKSLVLEMATCRFITAKENWLICDPRRGKGTEPFPVFSGVGRAAASLVGTGSPCSACRMLLASPLILCRRGRPGKG